MKNLFNFASLLSVLFLLISCGRSFDGKLSVETAYDIKGKDGKNLSLNVGDTDAVFTIYDWNVLKLKVSGDQVGEVQFKFPDGTKMPGEFGTVQISASKLNQSFDLRADMRPVSDTSTQITDMELCQIFIGTRIVCEPMPADDHLDHHEHHHNGDLSTLPPGCHLENMYRTGERQIVFHYATRATITTVEFKVPGTDDIIAKFTGSGDHKENRIIDSAGVCTPTLWGTIHYSPVI